MVKIGRRSNYNIDLIKLCIKKFSAETTKRLLMENLPTLHNDSSFAVQFSFSLLLRGENDLKQLDEIQATVVQWEYGYFLELHNTEFWSQINCLVT